MESFAPPVSRGTLGVLALLVPRTAERDYQIQLSGSYFNYLYELKPMLEQANVGSALPERLSPGIDTSR